MELIVSTLIGCFLIGVILSAPMGPIGILCVQRTLNKGRKAGFWTGVGAAISDLFYCLLTGVGISMVTDFIEAKQNILQVVGSAILLLFGIYLIKRNPANRTYEDNPDKKETYYQDMVTGFLFTVSNPLIVFLIIPLFARFSFPSSTLGWPFIILGYLFIVAGALSWWWVITHGVNAVRSKFSIRSLWKINIVIGVVILILSTYGLATGIRTLVMT